jgi:hypothetical protein
MTHFRDGQEDESGTIRRDPAGLLGRRDDSRAGKEASGSAVILQQATESFATVNDDALGAWRFVWRREEEKIAFTLVVLFRVMMIDVLTSLLIGQGLGTDTVPGWMQPGQRLFWIPKRL